MTPKRDSVIGQVKRIHPYAWLWEPLETEASFVLKSMFGSRAVYLEGKLVLCFSANEEPWRGVLICTDKTHHESLMTEFPSLTPHPVLPKWLYLPESLNDFESTAQRLVKSVRSRDSRIGVAPQPKKRKKLSRGIGPGRMNGTRNK
jgi:hypothetical protein